MPPPAAPAAGETEQPAEPAPTERTDVSWEVEAMTSPDYTAPRSIHEPEHDSWPVAAPDGTAAPAWDEDEDQLELTDVVDAEPEPLELTDVIVEGEIEEEAHEPDVPYVESEGAPGATFPLDAFIVPRGVEHVPAGYLEEIGALVADRLESLAQQIRRDGIQAVGEGESADELARVLGAIVAGYVARRA